MSKLILYIIIGYVVWILFRVIRRGWQSGGRDRQDRVHPRDSAGRGAKRTEKFPDIRDAEFEDLGPGKDGE